jgi:hypothetical protein
MPLINKKAIENENRTTIGQWSIDRRRKGINKPKRGYCFTMEQTSFGRMKFWLRKIKQYNTYVKLDIEWNISDFICKEN